jgi:hypothetical protein
MTKRAFWFGIAAWALTLSAIGCGGGKGCEELCTAADACPDVIPSDKTCKVRCEEQAKILEKGKCKEKQDAYDACVNLLEDVCNSSTECPTEAVDRNVCVDDYCTANPMTPGCTSEN